jgi:hypothetical protein
MASGNKTLISNQTPKIMTEVQKAQRWFNLKGIDCYANEDQLYVFVKVSDDLHHILVSTSEVIFRAELYDKELEKIAKC